MLARERRHWIGPGPSLHRSFFVTLAFCGSVGPIDFPLDGALLLGGLVGFLLEGFGETTLPCRIS
jgi:hypothetical protein